MRYPRLPLRVDAVKGAKPSLPPATRLTRSTLERELALSQHGQRRAAEKYLQARRRAERAKEALAAFDAAQAPAPLPPAVEEASDG